MISIPSLILILVIVILLFGTKKLKNIGSDLGGALKGFKKAVNENESKKEEKSSLEDKKSATIIEGEVIKEKDKTE
ncbi:twin-arginine translocase TatA/TatE family subunit [Aliikangiella sp. IMCC44359]|uniref:twin-arginine translocase TatA/TatE family subunit n=1 Tax=Aliikangiella sp. IMCC44359 TaxID=3459125 RepID=UPI00403AF8D2